MSSSDGDKVAETKYYRVNAREVVAGMADGCERVMHLRHANFRQNNRWCNENLASRPDVLNIKWMAVDREKNARRYGAATSAVPFLTRLNVHGRPIYQTLLVPRRDEMPQCYLIRWFI